LFNFLKLTIVRKQTLHIHAGVITSVIPAFIFFYFRITAKEFLETELAKHDTLLSSGEITRCLFNSQTAYQECKTKGVGRTT